MFTFRYASVMALTALFSSSGCGGVMSRVTTTTPASAPASCPVTNAPTPALVPPSPYTSELADGWFWIGTPALWTSLAGDGLWHGLHTDSGYGDKKIWY